MVLKVQKVLVHEVLPELACVNCTENYAIGQVLL